MNLRKSMLLGLSAFLLITQSVSASELLTISRSQEQAYCPAYFDVHYCSTDGSIDACAKGVEMVVSTPTPQPTQTPTPTNPTSPQSPVPTSPEKPASPEKPSSLDANLIFNMINQHRANLGLAAFEKEEKLCAMAQERGPELYDEIFTNGNIHGGFYKRNFPWWITENMKYGESEESVFNWWLSSPIHRKAIESDFIYSCGECYGNSCVQLFTSYTPK